MGVGTAVSRPRCRDRGCSARARARAPARTGGDLPRAVARQLQIPVQRNLLSEAVIPGRSVRLERGTRSLNQSDESVADPLLEALADRIRGASRITILTGAGVSAASGVPTFRGAGGLWRNFRAEDLATQAAFRRDPRLVWAWYAWRRETIAACRPNAAHEVIARWSKGNARLITQNVDDLHIRAGTERVIRLHGSIWELSCAANCGAPRWRDERVPIAEFPPKCSLCDNFARPAVVWFGESLAPEDLEAALEACDCDVFLTIGTSAVVYPAAGLLHDASRRGAFTVEINPERTPASSAVHLALEGAAEDVLPALDRIVNRSGPSAAS